MVPAASQDTSRGDGPVVVGVEVRQQPAVLTTAVTFARRFGAELVCAQVDPNRFAVAERSDGSVISMSIDPELGEERVQEPDPALAAAVTRTLARSGVRWRMCALAGSPVVELDRLAERFDACMIVVGTHAPGARASVREFFNGSVAAQLAHRQHRPVVVVPLDPVGLDAPLPWEEGR